MVALSIQGLPRAKHPAPCLSGMISSSPRGPPGWRCAVGTVTVESGEAQGVKRPAVVSKVGAGLWPTCV